MFLRCWFHQRYPVPHIFQLFGESDFGLVLQEWEAAFGDFLRKMEVDSDPCKPIDSSGQKSRE